MKRLLKKSGKSKDPPKTNDNENTMTQNLWHAAKAVLREVYSNTILPQETRKPLHRQPNVTPKTTGKRRTIKKKSQGERNHKDTSRNKGKINERNNSKY